VSCILFLGEQNQIRPVDSGDIGAVRVKSLKKVIEGRRDTRPGGLEKQGTKAVRAGTSIGIHISYGHVNLIDLKTVAKVVQGKGAFRINISKGEIPGGFHTGTKEVEIEIVQHSGFMLV
jgi:hypothetical protein